MVPTLSASRDVPERPDPGRSNARDSFDVRARAQARLLGSPRSPSRSALHSRHRGRQPRSAAALRAHWRTLLCTDRSAVGMGADFSVARARLYVLKANNLVGKCNGRLPGRPAAVERAVVAAAPAGRRGPRACHFAHAAAAWRSLRDRCARWRRRTRTPRGAIRSCVRTRARSRAPRRAPPLPWTTACARRSDSPRWPGTLPVPSVVPCATFVTCKCRTE